MRITQIRLAWVWKTTKLTLTVGRVADDEGDEQDEGQMRRLPTRRTISRFVPLGEVLPLARNPACRSVSADGRAIAALLGAVDDRQYSAG